MLRRVLWCVSGAVLFFPGVMAEAGWQAGVASEVITPPQFMPMAGYASRGREPATGKLTELWAKALVLEDDHGHRGVLVTLDLVGIDRTLLLRLQEKLKQSAGIEPHQLALNCSHTHSGPVVQGNLRPLSLALLNEDDQKLVTQYVAFLEDKIVAAVALAIRDLQPAELSWGSGTATFAVNRRANPEAEVPKLREAGMLKGPFDHAVPVLRVTHNGKLSAAVFGYACHNTTLSGFDWCGDYAGYAQMAVEEQHPGCVAMYWAGCGADQNPIPRREVAQAQQYGRELATAVHKVLQSDMPAVSGELHTATTEVPLPFAQLPSRDTLQTDSASTNVYTAARAKSLLAELDAGRQLSPTYPFPIATWKLGNDVTWVFLGGEVVVDYALRLKGELGDPNRQQTNVWVAGYSQDVMAYIPSRRVLSEGGYEGGGAMVYYGLPSPWDPAVEELIIGGVQQLLK